MNKIFISVIVLIAFAGAKPPDQIPQAQISNGIIKAKLYLPDTTNGYYRGARFDWSGVIPDLEYKGHTYFAQWFENYSPTLHDAIMGPVEDFFPVGYDEAKVGESFLKIGIGMIVKPQEPKYFFANSYQIINHGEWKVKRKSNEIEFTHILSDKKYSYEYDKKVQLIKGKPEMVLSHSLKNTGNATIETNVYDHNFFVMDNQPVDQNYVVTFPFNLKGEAQGKGDLGKIENNKVVFLKELTQNDHLFYQSLEGFGNTSKDYDIKIENHKTGAAVRITSDQPLSKIVFWSAIKTVCPEPYIHIKVNPGETFKWNIHYQFYICDTVN
jgi:hypothetical protein